MVGRVLIACSGLGHVTRGYETVSWELFQALRATARVRLARGGGPWLEGEGWRLPCFHRFGPLMRAIGFTGDRAYLVEQRSFAPAVYAVARLTEVDVIHLHDPGLMNAIWHLRRRFGGRFAIVFTNGGWLSPEHLGRPDLVHTLTPVDTERLRQAGFSEERVAMVPYGLRSSVPPERRFTDGLPTRLLGVGTLNDFSKGFATAIRAAAQLEGASLRLLGQRDEETPVIEALGAELLGTRFSTDTVPPTAVPAELAAAEVFLLPTRSEGFCMAVLEAMAAGLPCLVSDIPVLRWLVGDGAICLPVDRPDLWARALGELDGTRRRALSEAARRRAAGFTWEGFASAYLDLYAKAMRTRGATVVRPVAGQEGAPSSR